MRAANTQLTHQLLQIELCANARAHVAAINSIARANALVDYACVCVFVCAQKSCGSHALAAGSHCDRLIKDKVFARRAHVASDRRCRARSPRSGTYIFPAAAAVASNPKQCSCNLSEFRALTTGDDDSSQIGPRARWSI